MAAPNGFEQNAINWLTKGNPAPPGGAPSFSPEWIKQLHYAAGVAPNGATQIGLPPIENPTVPSAAPAGINDAFIKGAVAEGRLAPMGTTKGVQGPLVKPGPPVPGQMAQLMEDAMIRGSQPSEKAVLQGVGNVMSKSAQTPPVSPMMKAMGQGAQNAASFAAPVGDAAAPVAKGAGVLATAKGMLPLVAKGLGIGGQLADAYTQVADPNSSGNQIAAATKARTDALVAKGQNAAALGSNIRGIGEQAFNLSPWGAAARAGAAAAPVLRDFATGLFGGDPTNPPPPDHPSSSPVTAAAANLVARLEGRPDMHSTHPGAHTAEDWARANSHLTLGQLKALMELHPKPRSSKDVIGAQANNAIEQLYQQDLVNAKNAKAKSFWGNDADAQQQAAHSATLLRLQRLLGLAQGAAAPMAVTTLTPAED